MRERLTVLGWERRTERETVGVRRSYIPGRTRILPPGALTSTRCGGVDCAAPMSSIRNAREPDSYDLTREHEESKIKRGKKPTRTINGETSNYTASLPCALCLLANSESACLLGGPCRMLHRTDRHDTKGPGGLGTNLDTAVSR